MMNLIVPDVHGRKFWKGVCKLVNNANIDKIIFLGDYLDPYQFENISVEDAIANFEEILDFAEEHRDKVILLLGNHDMPYFSETYKDFSYSWSRHSYSYEGQISNMFAQHKDLFKIAYEDSYCLYTHAGVHKDWLEYVLKLYDIDIEPNAENLNTLLDNETGLSLLYMVSRYRGGRAFAGSPIWSDVNERLYKQESCNPENLFKYQIFGHTLQVFSEFGEIRYGKAIIENDFAMLDNEQIYAYDGNEIVMLK